MGALLAKVLLARLVCWGSELFKLSESWTVALLGRNMPLVQMSLCRVVSLWEWALCGAATGSDTRRRAARVCLETQPQAVYESASDVARVAVEIGKRKSVGVVGERTAWAACAIEVRGHVLEAPTGVQ